MKISKDAVLIFTDEEINMLKKISEIKAEACEFYACGDCPLHNTYICHPHGDETTHRRTQRIRCIVEKEMTYNED